MTTHTPWSHALTAAAGVRRLVPRGVLVVAVVTLFTVLATVSARLSPPGPVASAVPGGWIVALDDGAVVARVPDQPDRVLLGPWSVRPTEDAINAGEELSSREVAFDPVRRLLWYSDTHTAIRSLNIDSGEPGPFLLGFADLSAPGCGVTSDARHVAVDLKHRQLIVPTLTGNVLFYDLDDMTMNGGLGVAFFGDVVFGGFRHFASDPVTGVAWYANARGDFVEADLISGTRTGRVIPRVRQDHGAPNAFRPMTIDPARRLLVYRTAEGGFAAFDLETLQPTPVQFPALPGTAAALAYLAPTGSY